MDRTKMEALIEAIEEALQTENTRTWLEVEQRATDLSLVNIAEFAAKKQEA